jgi:hypothetical protein
MKKDISWRVRHLPAYFPAMMCRNEDVRFAKPFAFTNSRNKGNPIDRTMSKHMRGADDRWYFDMTDALLRRGLHNKFLQGMLPFSIDLRRMVGIAYTMRFIPFREDMNPLKGARKSAQPQARRNARWAMCLLSTRAATQGLRQPAIFTSADLRRTAVP